MPLSDCWHRYKHHYRQWTPIFNKIQHRNMVKTLHVTPYSDNEKSKKRIVAHKTFSFDLNEYRQIKLKVNHNIKLYTNDLHVVIKRRPSRDCGK